MKGHHTVDFIVTRLRFIVSAEHYLLFLCTVESSFNISVKNNTIFEIQIASIAVFLPTHLSNLNPSLVILYVNFIFEVESSRIFNDQFN